MCHWHQSIDVGPGRCPVIRAAGGDVIYELRVATGAPSVRLTLRCDAAGDVFVAIGQRRA